MTISKHTGRKDVVDKCLVAAAIRVCLRSAEASVRACGEKHTSNPGSPPTAPRRGGGVVGGVFPHMQRLVLLCQQTKRGSLDEAVGGVKCSRGS